MAVLLEPARGWPLDPDLPAERVSLGTSHAFAYRLLKLGNVARVCISDS